MDTFIPGFRPSCSGIRKEPILKLLETARNVENHREKLHQLYLSWNKDTWETIITLLGIRDEMRMHSFNSNYARLSGASATILGTGASIVGSLLAVPTAGLSLALIIGGTAIAATGGAISAGSHIANKYLSEKLCMDAKQVFELNLKCTEDVEESRNKYFKFLEEFKDQLDNLELKYYHKILSLLEEENLLNSFEDLHLTKCEMIYNSLPPTVSKMEEIKQNMITEEKSVISKYLIELMSLINKDPFMKKMIQDHIPKDLQPLVFPVKNAASDINPTQSLMQIANGISEAGKSLQFLFKEMTMVMRVGLSILNAIFFAWGIVDLVNASISIHHGSETDQIRETEQAARKLKKYRREVIRIAREIFEWDLEVKN